MNLCVIHGWKALDVRIIICWVKDFFVISKMLRILMTRYSNEGYIYKGVVKQIMECTLLGLFSRPGKDSVVNN